MRAGPSKQGPPVHADPRLDGYKIGFAPIDSAREDHGLGRVASGQRATITHADPHGKAPICKVGRDPQVHLIAEEADGLRRLAAAADSLLTRVGALRDLVEEHLRKFPGTASAPHQIGKVLTRSAGAVASALDKLVSPGTARMATGKPRSCRLTSGKPTWGRPSLLRGRGQCCEQGARLGDVAVRELRVGDLLGRLHRTPAPVASAIGGLAVDVFDRGHDEYDAGAVSQVGNQLSVPKTSSTSCDQAVFVDQTTDASLSSDPVLLEIDRFG